MEPQEFIALQITVLVRTDRGQGQRVKSFFDSDNFQYTFQDALGTLVKERLQAGEVDFGEVIVSFDAPALEAKKVKNKPSLLGRLFGHK